MYRPIPLAELRKLEPSARAMAERHPRVTPEDFARLDEMDRQADALVEKRLRRAERWEARQLLEPLAGALPVGAVQIAALADPDSPVNRLSPRLRPPGGERLDGWQLSAVLSRARWVLAYARQLLISLDLRRGVEVWEPNAPEPPESWETVASRNQARRAGEILRGLVGEAP